MIVASYKKKYVKNFTLPPPLNFFYVVSVLKLFTEEMF